VTRDELDRVMAQFMERVRAYEAAPGTLFNELVQIGFIDREGRVTTLLGGDAAMEPDAVPPVPDWPAARD
jgi:hypothetical protein